MIGNGWDAGSDGLRRFFVPTTPGAGGARALA